MQRSPQKESPPDPNRSTAVQVSEPPEAMEVEDEELAQKGDKNAQILASLDNNSFSEGASALRTILLREDSSLRSLEEAQALCAFLLVSPDREVASHLVASLLLPFCLSDVGTFPEALSSLIKVHETAVSEALLAPLLASESLIKHVEKVCLLLGCVESPETLLRLGTALVEGRVIRSQEEQLFNVLDIFLDTQNSLQVRMRERNNLASTPG